MGRLSKYKERKKQESEGTWVDLGLTKGTTKEKAGRPTTNNKGKGVEGGDNNYQW